MSFSKLERLGKVVAWLDSARWSDENQKSFSWQPDSKLSPSHELLVHWLTYITDIQRPWQDVWNVGSSVFREIVKSYLATDFQTHKDVNVMEREIRHFLDGYRPAHLEAKKVRPFQSRNAKYTPRFPDQHGFIERTLTILTDRYESDFIRFLGEGIKKWGQNPEGLRHLAFELYLLTYSNINLKKTVELLDKRNMQEKLYVEWDRFGYKRLWAALRDYRKARSYLALIRQGLFEIFGRREGNDFYKMWTRGGNFSLNLLELPGDVWNINFMQRVVKPLIGNSGLQIKKSWGASHIAREIYDGMPTKPFYPEQLDVSFDLSSKACENEDCELCPFGKYDLKDLCLLNTSGADRKYCPVALATCQYRMICNPKNCPVANRIGAGLCTQSS
jgi:hypothetical protein